MPGDGSGRAATSARSDRLPARTDQRAMKRIDTVVIGGGQAGLAMSRELSRHDVEHVVLERGKVGERWRSERWDSLTLLTPRWLSRLSGWTDDENDGDPHGFMSRHDVVRYLESYAEASAAPVRSGVTVTSVERHGSGFRIDTDVGGWSARQVVVATGESQSAFVPAMARDLAGWIHQVVPTRYRNPADLPDGGVLVVGASATGIQLAQEIHASGRPVILSVGRHTRLPRRYRGRDILAWLHDMGILDEKVEEMASLQASCDQPSLQLTGSPDHRTLDLRGLQEEGVRLVGRAEGAAGSRMFFADELVETLAAADLKLASLRMRIDDYITDRALASSVGPEEPFEPVPFPEAPPSLDLRREGIRSIVWATGFRRSYPWLRVPVLGPTGEIRHDGGVTPVSGLYVLGLKLLRRRSSSFLAGVGKDAEELAEHLVLSRNGQRPPAPSYRVA